MNGREGQRREGVSSRVHLDRRDEADREATFEGEGRSDGKIGLREAEAQFAKDDDINIDLTDDEFDVPEFLR